MSFKDYDHVLMRFVDQLILVSIFSNYLQTLSINIQPSKSYSTGRKGKVMLIGLFGTHL